MGQHHWAQGDFPGGFWLPKVRLGLWAQARGAPTLERRGGLGGGKFEGAGRRSKW